MREERGKRRGLTVVMRVWKDAWRLVMVSLFSLLSSLLSSLSSSMSSFSRAEVMSLLFSSSEASKMAFSSSPSSGEDGGVGIGEWEYRFSFGGMLIELKYSFSPSELELLIAAQIWEALARVNRNWRDGCDVL